MKPNEREFIGELLPDPDPKNQGRYRVHIPELMSHLKSDKGIWVKNHTHSQNPTISNNGIYGTYTPLQPGTKVKVKFYENDLNTGYADRIISDDQVDALPLGVGTEDRDEIYQLLRTPKNGSLIAINENTSGQPPNSIHIYSKQYRTTVVIDDAGVHIHTEDNHDVEVDGDEDTHVHKNCRRTVDQDDELLIKQNRKKTINQNEDIVVKQDRTTHIQQNEDIKVDQAITMSAGTTINIGAGGAVTVSGPSISISTPGILKLAGSSVEVVASGAVNLIGSAVLSTPPIVVGGSGSAGPAASIPATADETTGAEVPSRVATESASSPGSSTSMVKLYKDVQPGNQGQPTTIPDNATPNEHKSYETPKKTTRGTGRSRFDFSDFDEFD